MASTDPDEPAARRARWWLRPRWVVLGFVALVALYVGGTFVQVWAASRDDGARKADAIVVLGAAQYDGTASPALQNRLDHALSLYEDGLAPLVVVTGGRQQGDRFTEATVGYNFLRDHGVPDDAILVRSPHNAGGIAILWGNGGTDLLGAGRHQCWLTSEQADLDGSPVAEPCLEPIDPDLAWISRWSLLTRTPADPAPILRRPASTKSGHPAPGALGDALLLDSGDAATALYRTTSGWTLMDLGY